MILVHLLYPKRPLKDYIYRGDKLTSATIRTHIFWGDELMCVTIRTHSFLTLLRDTYPIIIYINLYFKHHVMQGFRLQDGGGGDLGSTEVQKDIVKFFFFKVVNFYSCTFDLYNLLDDINFPAIFFAYGKVFNFFNIYLLHCFNRSFAK